MHLKLQEAVTKADFDRITEAKKEIELLVEKHWFRFPPASWWKLRKKWWSYFTSLSTNLQDCNVEGYWRWEDRFLKIDLKIDRLYVTTTICRDGYAINLENAKLL